VLTKANARRKISLEINFVYLENKEIYRFLKAHCIIYVLFSTKYH